MKCAKFHVRHGLLFTKMEVIAKVHLKTFFKNLRDRFIQVCQTVVFTMRSILLCRSYGGQAWVNMSEKGGKWLRRLLQLP